MNPKQVTRFLRWMAGVLVAVAVCSRALTVAAPPTRSLTVGAHLTVAAPLPHPADDDLFGGGKKGMSRFDERIAVAVSVKPEEARPGEVVRLTVTETPAPGYHTYPLTQRSSDQSDSILTKLSYEDTPGLKPLWPVTESEPELVPEDLGNRIEQYLEHKNEFTWSQDILVLADASPGAKTLRFKLDLQVCDDKGCVPGVKRLEANIKVLPGPAVALSADLKARLNAPPPPVLVKSVGTRVGTDTTPPQGTQPAEPTTLPAAKNNGAAAEQAKPPRAIPITQSEEAYKSEMDTVQQQIQSTSGGAPGGLLAFMLTGVFWGAVSLVTPCVFPMIPITVSFFLKQSEKEHHRPLTMAVVYCLTIVVVLTIAAVALLSFFRWLSVNPYMNYALGGLFIFFALSLFGMYDIELPSGLAQYTSSREGKGGLLGVVFMALTFTIVSFACVAPFLGGFGGTAASSGFGLGYRVMGGLAFAATFAFPFFVLALFPSLLKKVPRSGSWLNSVKVVMGFLELAAAFKFFRAGELVQSAVPDFFTYDTVLGMWIAVALLCGLYLLNVYRLPHDSPAESIGVPRLIFGFLFLSLGFYLLPGLFRYTPQGDKQRPSGVVYSWVDSFLLPDPTESKGDLAWSGNLPEAIKEARDHRRRTGQPRYVFVDFTGETCTNCKFNENSVFSRSAIKPLFQPYRLVQLYTDKVPDDFYAADVRARFGRDTSRQQRDARDVNLPFQRGTFGTEQLPLYVILEPLPDGKVRVVNRYDEGKINDVEGFARFLKEPVENGTGARAQASP